MTYAEKWLKATNKCLKQKEYGETDNCELCKCCGHARGGTCYNCIVPKLQCEGENNFLACTDWFDSMFTKPNKVRRYLFELQYALKDYIRRNK